MTTKELIRAEIERRKELLTPHKGQGVILCREIIKQFDSLLSFIDTISQPIMKDGIIDEIRAEIERRFSEYNHDSSHHIQAAECASILAFLDTLTDEPVGKTCKTCEFYENDCPFTRGKFIPYPNIVCKDYTCSTLKAEQEPVNEDLTEAKEEYLRKARMTPGHEWMTRDIEDAFKAGAEWQKRKQQKVKGYGVMRKMEDPHPDDWYMDERGKEHCWGYKFNEPCPWPAEVYIMEAKEDAE